MNDKFPIPDVFTPFGIGHLDLICHLELSIVSRMARMANGICNINKLAKASAIFRLRNTLLWLSVDEGILRKMIQRIQRQIYVQIGPAQMESVNQLNVMDLLDSGFLKPGEIFIGQEILRVINQKP